MRTNYTRREEEEYNLFRTLFKKFVCTGLYATYCKAVFDLKIEGYREELKDKKFIVAGNHISALEPFLVPHAIRKPVAFLAKKELFEGFWSRLYMDFLGAIAVDRKKLEVSTIKTALSIKNTQWTLGFFPQGTRQQKEEFSNITRGFATLAKATKCDILPIATIGADEKSRHPFKSKIVMKIGKLIPYSNNIDEMVDQWGEAISKLTGTQYTPRNKE